MDFALHDYGNIVVIEPVTDGACNRMEVNVYVPRYMQMGKGLPPTIACTMTEAAVRIRDEIAQDFKSYMYFDNGRHVLTSHSLIWMRRVIKDVVHTDWDFGICYGFTQVWAESGDADRWEVVTEFVDNAITSEGQQFRADSICHRLWDILEDRVYAVAGHEEKNRRA